MIKKIPNDTMSYKFYNANPKDKRSSDCVLRAISTASGKTWDEVLDDLVTYAHKYKEMPIDPKCYSKYLEDLGFIKMSQPRHENNTKYTGSEFCRLCSIRYTNGETIVAHIGGNHMVAIMPTREGDGINDRYKVLDIWNSTGGTIGNYWIKTN